jgi:REP element-mobilizing transposase RayT
MSDSHAEIYVHFVWSTKGRVDCIPEHLERDLYRVIGNEAKRMGCMVIAVGGTANHLHVLTRFGRTVSCARFMEQVKGVASRFLNDHVSAITDDPDGRFRWQGGYGALSLSEQQVPIVSAYVHNQKAHHASGSVKNRWEPPDDPPPTVLKSPPT